MSSSEIEQVKQASDIIAEIGSRISLQRVGANYRALCPFHAEKSPSFYVNESLQRYKCFGCNESGDVFTFLEKYDGMTFAEALRHLAEKAGISLSQRSFDTQDQTRQNLLGILNQAQEYYSYLLNKHRAGEEARIYLKNRGIFSATWQLYGMGYSLNSWDGLSTYLLKKKKHNPELVAQTGLIIKGKNGWYDRFRNRVMFPLKDMRGVVVGFSGRLLVDNQAKNQKKLAENDKSVISAQEASNSSNHEEAKYINTPETMLYHKGKMLYGFAEHRQAIREKKSIVLVEGEFDVISSAQAHVGNVAGLKGSALTLDHVTALSRTVDSIILALDADSAGMEATKRAITLLQETPLSRSAPLELKVSVVPQGKDPDELARNNPNLWRETIKKSRPAYEYLITTVVAQHGIDTPISKKKILYELSPFLKKIEHAVEKEYYVQLLANLIGSSKTAVNADIESLSNRSLKGFVDKKQPQIKKEVNKSLEEKAEDQVLFVWSRLPSPLFLEKATIMGGRRWRQPSAGAILTLIIKHHVSNMNDLAPLLAEDLKETVFQWHTNPILEKQLGNVSPEKIWSEVWNKLQIIDSVAQIKAIQEQIQTLEAIEDPTLAQLAEIDALSQKLKDLITLRRSIENS